MNMTNIDLGFVGVVGSWLLSVWPAPYWLIILVCVFVLLLVAWFFFGDRVRDFFDIQIHRSEYESALELVSDLRDSDRQRGLIIVKLKDDIKVLVEQKEKFAELVDNLKEVNHEMTEQIESLKRKMLDKDNEILSLKDELATITDKLAKAQTSGNEPTSFIDDERY